MSQAFRSMQLMVVLLLSLIGLWLALPSITSIILERWLQRQGYENVVVTLGRPGLRSMTIPNLGLTRRVTGETVTITLNNAQADYTLLGLLAGRVDLLILRRISIEILKSSAGLDQSEGVNNEATLDAPDSLLNMLTASDVVQRLPLFPCDEVRIEDVKVFREQATGPLRTVVMTGTIKRERETLVAEMLLQGIDTIPYEMRVTGGSVADMSLQLKAAKPNSTPLILWRSQSIPKEGQVHVEGVLEVNVQELAPFLALAVPIGPEWRRAGGSVTIHWAGTAAAGMPVSTLWKDPATEVHATVQVAAALPELKGYGKDLAVKATGSLSGNVRLVHWSLAAGASVTATVSSRAIKGIAPLAAFIHYGPQPMRLESQQESTGELFWTESPPRYSGIGRVLVSYGSPKGPIYAECIVSQISGHGRVLDQAAATMLVRGNLPAALNERLHMKNAAVELGGTMGLAGTALRGTLSPSSSVTFAEFNHPPFAVNAGIFRLEEPFQIDVELSTGLWTSGPANLLWRSPLIQAAGTQVTMQRAVIKLDPLGGSSRTYHGQATTTFEGVSLTRSSVRSRPVDVSVRLLADPLMVKADVQAHSQDESVKFSAQFEHDWATAQGTARVLLGPMRFDRATFRLGQVLSPWPYPVDATSGHLAGNFDVRWTTDGSQQVHVQSGSGEVTVTDLTGHYRDIVLTGVTTKVKVAMEGLERLVISKPADVAIASIQTGIHVTDLAMTVEGEWDLGEKLPLVEVRNIRCALLGGTMTSQGTRADLGYPPFGFTALVRQLDLHEILSLEQQQGLQGTGTIDGAIPVTITSKGVTVKDGSFEARPPGGVIRYAASPESMHMVTQANANMQVVLRALNNFHYNMLQVGAQYAEDGTLQLNAKLEGKNPDQHNSPPIHFNLTVQENIPALLKSLRLVTDLEDSVRKSFVRP